MFRAARDTDRGSYKNLILLIFEFVFIQNNNAIQYLIDARGIGKKSRNVAAISLPWDV